MTTPGSRHADTRHADIRRTIDTVWRIESARVIAGLVRMVRDVDLAEELAQDALVAALEKWPGDGIPDKPGAWLMATAKHRAIDRLRHGRLVHDKHDLVAQALEDALDDARIREEDARDAWVDGGVGDDLLRLVFIACHPLLPMPAQVALTLRLLGGLTTDEIARAFLQPEATIAQRIVRAKRTLADAGAAFELPRGEALAERLASVLAVLYPVFNEGYAATAGDDWMRPQLCEEALRLGRIVAGLMPREPEVHGLVALMELQASRTHARTASDGAPVLLLEQDRGRWDRLLIRRGLDALARAEQLGGAEGAYALQAAIAACHARAPTADATDWPRIAALYAVLGRVAPSPVVELNRAVAVSMVAGPAAGLALADALADEPALQRYHLLPSVRGELLVRLGRNAEARSEFLRAAELTRNARERTLLQSRAAACEDRGRAGA